jgi:hypothetical protein
MNLRPTARPGGFSSLRVTQGMAEPARPRGRSNDHAAEIIAEVGSPHVKLQFEPRRPPPPPPLPSPR